VIFLKLQMTKIQITNKSQIQIFNDQNIAGFEFGIWELEFIYSAWRDDLRFVILVPPNGSVF